MANLQMLPFSLSKFNQKKIDMLANKVMVFVVPGRVKLGVQPNEIRFPWEGQLMDVYVTCRKPGGTDTLMKVQKISVEEFNALTDEPTGWVDVTENLSIPANQRILSSELSLLNIDVTTNDHFRVVIDNLGTDIEDITIEVTIKTDFLNSP